MDGRERAGQKSSFHFGQQLLALMEQEPVGTDGRAEQGWAYAVGERQWW
jgi:hypothetical protein